MSFSAEVKNELLEFYSSKRNELIGELIAYLFTIGTLKKLENDKIILVFQSENEEVVGKCFTLLRKICNIKIVAPFDEKILLKGRHFNGINLSKEDLKKLLELSKLHLKNEDDGCIFIGDLNSLSEDEKRAFIRGAFLGSGSMSDPNKGYHFEITASTIDKAKAISDLIKSLYIETKIVPRKNYFVIYVKEGDVIVDLLALMGANGALMDLENIRILKEMRNRVNRKVNCETANINKTVSAAVKQIEDIKFLEGQIGLNNLPETLREVAKARLRYPEATLKELGEVLEPKVGKSGVNHRLRKLMERAEELRFNKEEIL